MPKDVADYASDLYWTVAETEKKGCKLRFIRFD